MLDGQSLIIHVAFVSSLNMPYYARNLAHTSLFHHFLPPYLLRLSFPLLFLPLDLFFFSIFLPDTKISVIYLTESEFEQNQEAALCEKTLTLNEIRRFVL